MKKAGKLGKGIFAKKDFSKGSTLFIIKGEKKSFSKKIKSHVGPRWIGIALREWISPNRDSPLWYLNHSCDPNAARVFPRKIIAIKKIRAGDQVTIDYSLTEEDENWFMTCHCGVVDCRKKIGSIHSLPLKTFKKNVKFIPPSFIEEYTKKNYY